MSMVFEAAVWVGVALAAPWLARRLRLTGPEGAATEASLWLRAAYGVLPTYMAWIRGAVTGRDLGLFGPPVPVLIGGALVIVAGLLAAAVVRRRSGDRGFLRTAWLGERSAADLFDTPRWALFRAAGILWTGTSAPGMLAGWVIAVIDDVIRSGRLPALGSVQDRGRLIWLTASFVLLGLSGSLWLVLAAQAVVLWVRRRPAS